MTVKPFFHYCLVLLIFLGSSYSVFHTTRHLQIDSEYLTNTANHTFEISPDEHDSHSQSKHLQQICDTCLVLFGFKAAIYNDSFVFNLLNQTTRFVDSSHTFLFKNKAYYHSRAPPFTA